MIHATLKNKAFFLFFVFIAICFSVLSGIPNRAYARAPHDSELVTVSGKLDTNTVLIIRATSTDPYYITRIVTTIFGNSKRVYLNCGVMPIVTVGTEISSGKTEVPQSGLLTYSDESPLRCAGSLWMTIDNAQSGHPAGFTITGFSMSSSDFDEQPTSGGGGETSPDFGENIDTAWSIAWSVGKIVLWLIGLQIALYTVIKLLSKFTK